MNSDDDNADDAATSAGAGPSDETTSMPPPTEAAPELAWSIDTDDLFPGADKNRLAWRGPLAMGRGGRCRAVAGDRDHFAAGAVVRRSPLAN